MLLTRWAMFDFIIDYLVKFKPFEQHMHGVRFNALFIGFENALYGFGLSNTNPIDNIEIIETDESKIWIYWFGRVVLWLFVLIKYAQCTRTHSDRTEIRSCDFLHDWKYLNVRVCVCPIYWGDRLNRYRCVYNWIECVLLPLFGWKKSAHTKILILNLFSFFFLNWTNCWNGFLFDFYQISAHISLSVDRTFLFRKCMMIMQMIFFECV